MLSCKQGYEYQVLICVHVNTKTGIRPITEILKVHVNTVTEEGVFLVLDQLTYWISKVKYCSVNKTCSMACDVW